LAIAAVSISGIMEGKTVILISVGGAACAFTIGAFICEGMIFSYYVTNFAFSDLLYDYEIRNVSSAIKFMKNAYEQFYKQAEDNLKEKYPDALLDFKSWDEAKDAIGNISQYTVPILNYNYSFIFTFYDFLNCDGSIEQCHNLIQFDIDEYSGFLNARYGGFEVPVASWNFNYTGQKAHQIKEWFCWNKTETSGLKCKKIDIEGEYIYPSPSTEGVFGFHQNIFKGYSKDKKIEYHDLVDQDANNITVNYRVPMVSAYHMISRSEIKACKEHPEKPENCQYVYDKADKYYRLNPLKIIKHEYKQTLDYYTGKINKFDSFSFCDKEPMIYNHTFDEDHNCRSSSIKLSKMMKQLPNQFRDVIVGRVPSFYSSYRASQTKDYIFSYSSIYKLAQFSIANLIIQVLAVICWGIGKGLGQYLKKGD